MCAVIVISCVTCTLLLHTFMVRLNDVKNICDIMCNMNILLLHTFMVRLNDVKNTSDIMYNMNTLSHTFMERLNDVFDVYLQLNIKVNT